MAEHTVDMRDVSSSINSSTAIQDTPYFTQNTTLSRELHKYRAKYLFCQPCSVFCKSIYSRILSGKTVYLVLLMLALEQIAYQAASDYLIQPFIVQIAGRKLDYRHQTLVRTTVMYVAADLLFPVMGWVADTWVGQYHMMHGSLWVMWVGYAGMAVVYSLFTFITHSIYILLPFLFLIISVGHAGFQSSAIPYGANQITYRTSQELSSYFYFYYWIRNFGFLCYVLLTACEDNYEFFNVVCMMTAVVCMSLVLILNGCCKRHFPTDKERPNPYKKVLQVLYLAAVIKRPIHRSAFSFNGALPPSRIDLTKQVHGGKFKSEDVEDVKTFLRLLLILAFIFPFLAVHGEIFQTMPLQMHDMNSTVLKQQIKVGILGDCQPREKFAIAYNVLLILVFIPLLNSVLYPFLREYMPNMLKRIGFGVLMAVLAQVSILVISATGAVARRESDACALSFNFADESSGSNYTYSPVSEFYLLIPFTLITVMEIFIVITSLEFFYAQSPHQMRGMMIGLAFFAWGLGSAVSQVMMTAFGELVSPLTCDCWYYLVYLCLALLGVAGYMAVSCTYKNRQRGERDDSNRFYRLYEDSLWAGCKLCCCGTRE